MAVVLPNGKNYFATSTGAPLAGGKVYAYVAGTTTPKDTYTTSAASVANTNPVILNSRGEAAIYWTGTYDVVLKDSADVTIWGPERLVQTEGAESAAAMWARLANTSVIADGDAMVGVKRTAAGAIATTQHAWHEGQVLNVKTDFGAVGDGAADDTAEVQAAITAGAGKVVYFPPGIYKITSTLTMLAQTTLQGAGGGFGIATILRTPTDIITLTATSTAPGTGVPIYGLTVRDIRFENTLAVVAGAGMTNYQIKFIEPALACIENCTLVNLLADDGATEAGTDYNANNGGGIWFTNSSSSGIWLNRIHRCGIQGRVLLDVTDSIISECYVFAQNCAFGIKINGGNITVANCFDINGGRVNGGIWLNQVSSCKIVNNFFDIFGIGIYSDRGVSNTISGNTAQNSHKTPIFLDDPLDFTVYGNAFVNCGTMLTAGVSSDIVVRGVTVAAQKNTIFGNTHRRTDARGTPSYAIHEINSGFDPISNVYFGNTIADTGTEYNTPAILRIVTTGTTAAKLKSNSGKGTDTELLSSFTGTLTGCTTSPTASISYSIEGNVATLTLPAALTATSNTTACTITGLPAALTPVNTQNCAITVEDNTVFQSGTARVSGTTITLLIGTLGNFTAAGTKGASGFTISYALI